jgi:hypothetical protein
MKDAPVASSASGLLEKKNITSGATRCRCCRVRSPIAHSYHAPSETKITVAHWIQVNQVVEYFSEDGGNTHSHTGGLLGTILHVEEDELDICHVDTSPIIGGA